MGRVALKYRIGLRCGLKCKKRSNVFIPFCNHQYMISNITVQFSLMMIMVLVNFLCHILEIPFYFFYVRKLL